MQGLNSYLQDAQAKRMFYHCFAPTSYLKYKTQGIRHTLSLFIANEEGMMCTSSDFRDNPRSVGSGAICLARLLPEQSSHAVLDAFLCLLHQGQRRISQRGEERCQITPCGPGMLQVPSRLPALQPPRCQESNGAASSVWGYLNPQPSLTTPQHCRKPGSLRAHPSPL